MNSKEQYPHNQEYLVPESTKDVLIYTSQQEVESQVSENTRQSLQEVSSPIVDNKIIGLEKRVDEQSAFEKEIPDHKADMIDGIDLPQTHASISQTQVNTTISGTSVEVQSSKAESVEYTVNKIKDQITTTKRQVRFAARGEGKDVREVKRYIIEWLNLATKRVNKYERYHKKFDEKDNVLKPEHEAAMFVKISTLLSNSNDYVSQAITWDINEAKKFFPPNVFDDASYYIPDKLPGQQTLWQQVPGFYKNLSPEQQRLYRNCREQKWPNGIRKLWGLIDNNMNPWLVENGFNPQWANIVSWAAKLGLLVVNGVTLWNMGKSVFGMIFWKEGKTRGQLFQKFLINAGIFTGLNFIDPDKAIAKVKDTRSWMSGKEVWDKTLYTKNWNADFSNALISLQDPNILPEKRTGTGTAIAGFWLTGLDYGEAASNNIFQTNGNNITGVNTNNLKEFYKAKYISKTKERNKYIEYVNSIEKMQQSDPTLFSKVMSERGITAQDLQKPELASIIIGTHVLENYRIAKEVHKWIMENELDVVLKETNPNIVEEIGATNYDNLVSSMEKLPNDIKDQISEWSIELRTVNGKVFIKSNEGEVIGMDLDSKKISIANEQEQFIEFPDEAANTEELLRMSIVLSKRIPLYTHMFNTSRPWQYTTWFNNSKKIYANVGDAIAMRPSSRINGQNVTIIDGWSLSWDNLNKFKNDDILGRFTDYLNDLNIWKWDNTYSNNTTLPSWETSTSWGSNTVQKTPWIWKEKLPNPKKINPQIRVQNIRNKITNGAIEYVKRIRDSWDIAGRNAKKSIETAIKNN